MKIHYSLRTHVLPVCLSSSLCFINIFYQYFDFSGNPCEEDKPFLCRSSPTCIALEQVCDSIPQCPDGFDESPALCNASKFIKYYNLFSLLFSPGRYSNYHRKILILSVEGLWFDNWL